MKICIVTHCYAKELTRYATLLKCQMSSLTLYQPKVSVEMHVCYTPSDTEVVKVLTNFNLLWKYREGLEIYWGSMGEEFLGRRAIGRNQVALAQTCNYVWFADADYMFGPGCLDEIPLAFDRLKSEGKENVSLVYPGSLMIHRDHKTGDDSIRNAESVSFPIIRIDEYIPCRYRKAIGGTQIVTGDFARKYGYLQGTKWCKPLKPGESMFGRSKDGRTATPDDVAYRSQCATHGSVEKVALPNLYRMRHTNVPYTVCSQK